MSDRIEQIAEAAREHVPTLILGMREEIERAITNALDAAREDDAKAVLRIPVAITWDIDSWGVKIAATVSHRVKSEVTVQLDDPDQPRLPLDGDEGEIPPKAKSAVDGIVDTLRADGVTVTANRRLS